MALDNAGPPPEILERKKLGVELRARYELYFVTAAFTFAGLAIQTAKAGPGSVPIAEVGAWICFLVSGLIGLWRYSQLWIREFGVAKLYEAEWEPGDRHKQIRKELTLLDDNLAGFHKVQFLFFVIALVLAAWARAAILY